VQKLGHLQLARPVDKPDDDWKQDTNQHGMYVCTCIDTWAIAVVIFRAVNFYNPLVEIVKMWLCDYGNGWYLVTWDILVQFLDFPGDKGDQSLTALILG